MKNHQFRTAIATAILIGAGVVVPRGAAGDLGIPGRANANPSVAASGSFVAVAWGAATGEGATAVYVAVSRNGGGAFGTPVRVSDAASPANLSGEQPPRIALVARRGLAPAITVVWTSKGTSGTRLVSSESRDGGKSFGRPAVVAGTDAPGNRGWETVATDRDGRVVAIWLDHRDMAASAEAAHLGHGAHQPGTVPRGAGDGAERARMSKVFFGRLGESADPRPISDGVCYCCKTALATGADGSIYAAWRHVYPGNIRDIAFAMSRDRGRTFSGPVRISEDGWQLDGCPENGPALAVDAASRIHVVWPTLITEGGHETLALFHAASRDGRTFTRRVRIVSNGPAYHPQIAVAGDGALVVAWDELSNHARRVTFARGMPGPDDSMTFVPMEAPVGTAGSYPAIAATATGVVAVWTKPAESGSRIAFATVSGHR